MPETSKTETFHERLERQAQAVLAAWNKWVEADGWDNPELDTMELAIFNLRQTLERKPA